MQKDLLLTPQLLNPHTTDLYLAGEKDEYHTEYICHQVRQLSQRLLWDNRKKGGRSHG